MSRITIGVLFATIGLIIIATYFDLPYFGDGAGVVLVAGLCLAVVLARREASLMTYVLSESQIVSDDDEGAKPAVPQGMPEPAPQPTKVAI